MNLDLRYHGKSGMREHAWGHAMTFEPNLSRSKVFFDGELVNPLRFREAISALHDVVIGDLRFKAKDKTAYKAFLAQKEAEEAQIRRAAHDKALAAEVNRIAKEPVDPALPAKFRAMHSLYWTARRKWASELAANDPAMFRALVPCDPVVTVAPDVVMFECFAKDEASYGCLSVDREALRGADQAALGTTNVDYSLALFEHFQTIRTYRPTRLFVDPAGFEVATGVGSAVREEKIDLPASWLRGFGQLQAAMALPARRVELSTDVVYSLLVYLKRHREKTGPRALAFHLTPGKPVEIEIQPFGVRLVSRGKLYDGPQAETIKVWGRRRLMAFARTLPIAERFDVQLLGTGLPSVWVARMGEMRLTLALSGWTTNDWAGGSALDQYFAGFAAHGSTVARLATFLQTARRATLTELVGEAREDDKVVLGSLHELAKRGQLAYDFASGLYRWRPILDVALTDAMLGPEPEETREGKRLAAYVEIERTELVLNKQLVVGKVEKTQCEAMIDSDGVISRAKCSCSYFFRTRLRAGPCRHLLALRLFFVGSQRAPLPVARIVDKPPRTSITLQLVDAQLRAATDAQIESAWLDARDVVRTWSDAPTTAHGSKVARTVQLTASTVAEIQHEAARLDVSVSTVVEAAWHVAGSTSRFLN